MQTSGITVAVHSYTTQQVIAMQLPCKPICGTGVVRTLRALRSS